MGHVNNSRLELHRELLGIEKFRSALTETRRYLLQDATLFLLNAHLKPQSAHTEMGPSEIADIFMRRFRRL